MPGTSDGRFYEGTARTLVFNNNGKAPFTLRGTPWSASPVSQEEEGTDAVLFWPDDPRRRMVGARRGAGQAPAPKSLVVGPLRSGAVVGEVATAAVPARFAASSSPAAFLGSTNTQVNHVSRGRAMCPAMQLSFVPLRNTAASSSSGQNVP